jgi:hypothetical protein
MRIFAAAVVFTISGCATVTVTGNSQISEQVGRIPEHNTDARAPVGGTVYSQYRYWSKTGYRLEDPAAFRVLVVPVKVEVGEFIVPADAGGEPAYCTERNAYVDPLSGTGSKVCFITPIGRSSFNKAKVAPGMVWLSYDLPTPIRFSKSELVVPRIDALKSELLYQGYSNKTIKLSYREYAGDFARPAFFQDVSYDITEFPTTVTFKTVKLNLLGADNNGLRYQVLSGF